MSRHFRAKVYRKNRRTGEYYDCGWVYGDLHHDYNGSYCTMISNICDIEMTTKTYDVESTTVGQYTGKDDITNKNIYEGDVVRMIAKNKSWHSVNGFTGVVVFDTDLLQFTVVNKSEGDDFAELADKNFSLEVIANIYDKPEWKKAIKPLSKDVKADTEDLPF
jgi:uncharacterized phage protein (TIGR01671 family)